MVGGIYSKTAEQAGNIRQENNPEISNKKIIWIYTARYNPEISDK